MANPDDQVRTPRNVEGVRTRRYAHETGPLSHVYISYLTVCVRVCTCVRAYRARGYVRHCCYDGETIEYVCTV